MSLSIPTTGHDGLRFALDRKTCRNGEAVNMTISAPANARRGTDYRYSLVSRSMRTPPISGAAWSTRGEPSAGLAPKGRSSAASCAEAG